MKEKEFLISITIPTFNSGKTIERTLESIKNQTYKNYEIIIVDHYSTDETLSIVKRYTKKIYMDKKRLLSSRRIGADRSKGDVVIFIDSDHVLEPTLLERTARFFQNTDIDMAILEEKGFNPKKIVQKMYNLDRKNIHEGLVINPFKGVLGSRIFKKDLMMKTFDKIDKKLDNIIVVQDHAIIYYEAWRISKKIGMIKNALFHIDPSSFYKVFKHYYDCGKFQYLYEGSKNMIPKKYETLFEEKMKNRFTLINWLDINHWMVLPLIFTKGFGFTVGLFLYNNKTILKIKRTMKK